VSIEAKDLVKIIKACVRANVTELKIDDVSIKFGPSEVAKPPEQKSEILVPSQQELEAESEKALVLDNVESAEERLANLQIENPALFEQLLLERELENSGGSTFN
jgi:hypothetical protein